ncbi:dihydroorotase [Elongatibacter sediminis]|uniref:Dihydroorotase n=1 Tax=Elongatibacter sediminis TaxID=3119006 RepID=A0AAW9RDH7_9GAMM
MPQRLLIKNALLVNEGDILPGDLLIDKGRIARIDREIAASDSDRILDAGGLHVMPGMIDDQVHFREPGLTHKGDIGSESRAAVAGGITSFMEMPNTLPPTVTLDALEDKYRIAERSAHANYAFYLGATNDNLDVVRALDPKSAAGIKVFMGASTGNMLVDDETVLRGIFRDARVPITTHCESTPMIQKNLAAALDRYGENIPVTEHPVIRNAEVCYASSSMAVALAREAGAQLHVLHLTTEREMELFEPGPVEGKSITAEVCVHHLIFSADDYASMGNRIKCNPAVKSAADRDALRLALREGRIDIIATDHAPHTREEKASDNYLTAPAGLPLVQEALPAALELYHDDMLSLPGVVERTAHNPAVRFSVGDRGFLREGYYADLVVVDLSRPTEPSAKRVLSRCGWSPFEGRALRSSIVTTLVNGVPAWQDGKVCEHDAAMRLRFDR